MLSKELVMKSAFRLKDYDHAVFISRELSTSDTKLEKDCLRKRRFLIEDKQIDQKNIRIRNLKLETKYDDNWVEYSENKDTATESESEWLSQINLLSFNVRSILNLQRRMVFSNSISKTNYDSICLSETWLTSEIPNSALFLPA